MQRDSAKESVADAKESMNAATNAFQAKHREVEPLQTGKKNQNDLQRNVQAEYRDLEVRSEQELDAKVNMQPWHHCCDQHAWHHKQYSAKIAFPLWITAAAAAQDWSSACRPELPCKFTAVQIHCCAAKLLLPCRSGTWKIIWHMRASPLLRRGRW